MQLKAWLLLMGVCLVTMAPAQSDCITSAGPVYGTVDDERALSVSAAADGSTFYVGGSREDSTLIVCLDLKGLVLWSRAFDLVPGRSESCGTITIDSEGNIVLAGVAGNPSSSSTIYACKYDPINHVILWAKEYPSTWTRTYFNEILEMGPGTNYLIVHNPHSSTTSNDDAELFEINRTNGNIISTNAIRFGFGGSESLVRVKFHGNYFYGVGRYTDGGSTARMRHTITKVNTATNNTTWTRMGHIPANASARLYGADMVIEDDQIYSVYMGDPSGTSLSNSKVFIQSTDLDGNVSWVKQYDIPGSNDWAYDMIRFDGGLAVLTMKRSAPNQIILFKIDFSGDVVWGKALNLPMMTNMDVQQFGTDQIAQVGNQLVLSGYGSIPGNGSDMIIAILDKDGELMSSCGSTQNAAISVSTISNPAFYAINPSKNSITSSASVKSPSIRVTTIYPLDECIQTDTLEHQVSAAICQGESYEGYTIPGTYQDYWVSTKGCDSIRILELMVWNRYNTNESITICNGQMYLGYSQPGIYTDTLMTVQGCDSIRTLLLEVEIPTVSFDTVICSGEMFWGQHESGIYTDTLQAAFDECDTLQILNLTVLPPAEGQTFRQVCTGQIVDGYSQSGIYLDTFQSQNGCDSIRILELEVVDIVEAFYAVSVCEGEAFEGHEMAGMYQDTFQSTGGCDSIRYLELAILESSFSGHQFNECDPGNTLQLDAGEYVDSLQNIAGCDSIVQIVVSAESVYIPNIFSPNNDGINDVFTLYVSNNRQLEIEYFGVFDRFGDMVYETTKWPVHWNGSDRNNKPFQPGVFAYILIWQCGQRQLIRHGDVTLLE